jgi:hypothetical protein
MAGIVIRVLLLLAVCCSYVVIVAACSWLRLHGSVGMYLAIGLVCIVFAGLLLRMGDEEY